MSHSVLLFLLIPAPALALVLALLGLEMLEGNILGWLDLVIGVGYSPRAIIHFWLRREPFRQLRNGGDENGDESGNRSFWLILPGLLTTFFAPLLEYFYLPGYLPRTGWMQAIGLTLIVFGAASSCWAVTALNGRATRGKQFIHSGPYRYLRHPGYTGCLLIAFGFCIGYSSVIGLAAIPILLLPGFAYRVNLEEKLLTASFGDEYRAYARRTKRILPGIW
jgi:protein-S-isoprenylcysteine O-methyltransferase Ste14